MANIPLRAYIREIEGLIDSGQLEETVAHCRHTLQSFPKCIDIYRLLGKVFLEARQFSNAGDILQRVLSAVPDDFVSHVGMSIIREDEGNLDASIWHMERAFENQPANNAIQGELKRLFGRRDGMEPPKIRLTRGALARMYAKGNLYDQAVAELRGALSEDPQRPDLQLLLAKMYFLSGDRVDAVETSSNILKKFPNCLLANRILALILPQTDRAEDAQIYRQRSNALDPYLSRAGSDILTSEDVPDSAVMIDTLEWKPGQTIPGLPEQPAWAGTLGIKFEEPEEEELPEWLTEDLEIPAYEGEQVAPFIDREGEDLESPEIEDTEVLIPEWMQDAGWQPASGEGEGADRVDDLSMDVDEETDIEKAELPEWLKEIAPEDAVDDEAILEISEDEEIPTWLDESPPGATDSIITWLDEKDDLSESSAATSQMDDEFVEMVSPQGESVVQEGEETTDEIEIPDWLKDLETEGELDLSLDEAPSEDELPEWLEELEKGPDEIIKPGERYDEIIPEEEVEITEPEEVEDQIISEIKEEDIEEIDLDDQDAALAWLESLAAKQGASEDELITSPEERQEIPPEWVREEEFSSEEEILSEPSQEEKPPDWLQESGSVDEQIDIEEPIKEEDELPEWLRDLDAGASEDLATELPGAADMSQEIDSVDFEESASIDTDDLDLSGEKLSDVESPIELSPESGPPSESAEWIPETQVTEEPPIEETPTIKPSFEEFGQIDESAVGAADEVISTIELTEGVTQVDINAATLSELEKIPGIGFVLAQSIVDYREKHGPFNTIDELKNVSGIGEVSFESLRDHLDVEEPEETQEVPQIEEVTIDNEVFEAHKALERGDLERAVEAYDNLIKRGQYLDEIISHLEQGLSQVPDNIHLWQTLGDAYMRDDQFQRALDAYTKAEKLL